jgi:uncharacterized protein YkwD
VRKKFVLIGAILFVLVALAITTFLVKQNQDNRQRASGDTLSTIVTSGTRDSFKSWASTKTIAQINDEVAALSQADRDALANLVIETNLTGADKDKLMVAFKKVLNNKTTGFYSEIWSYTHLNITAGTGGGNATCNSANLSIKDADAATFLDTLFHESLHSFNCVNSGPDGALNEGSAIWIFKVAFPEGRNPDELTSGFAETVYGTVNYYRDYGVDGNHSIPLTAIGNTTPKSKELFTWLSSVDGSHLPYADQTKLQYCYDTYYKNIPRTDPDWFAKAKTASQSMVADPKCYTPTQNTTPTPTTTNDAMLDQEEWNFIKIINDYRATFNLQPLKVSKTLYKAAKWMTEDMKNQQKLNHIDSLGRNPWQRATAFGYPGQASENAAVTSGGLAQSVFVAWRDGCDADSTGKCTYAHREGMKGATDRAIGIARFPDPNGQNWWWTADFGPTLDAEITQTPTPSVTNTPTPTATQVPTGTPTTTTSVTPTVVTLPTNTPTNTPTPTPTKTPTPTPTNTPTPTPSPTPTTPITPTPTVIVITQPPSPTPTNTPTPAQGQASLTPTLSPTPTVVIATATNTPSPTSRPTATPTIAKPGGIAQTFGVIGGIFIVIVAGIFLLAL